MATATISHARAARMAALGPLLRGTEIGAIKAGIAFGVIGLGIGALVGAVKSAFRTERR